MKPTEEQAKADKIMSYYNKSAFVEHLTEKQQEELFECFKKALTHQADEILRNSKGISSTRKVFKEIEKFDFNNFKCKNCDNAGCSDGEKHDKELKKELLNELKSKFRG